MECGSVKEPLKFEKKLFGAKWVTASPNCSLDLAGKCEVMNEAVNCVALRRQDVREFEFLSFNTSFCDNIAPETAQQCVYRLW